MSFSDKARRQDPRKKIPRNPGSGNDEYSQDYPRSRSLRPTSGQKLRDTTAGLEAQLPNYDLYEQQTSHPGYSRSYGQGEKIGVSGALQPQRAYLDEQSEQITRAPSRRLTQNQLPARQRSKLRHPLVPFVIGMLLIVILLVLLSKIIPVVAQNWFPQSPTLFEQWVDFDNDNTTALDHFMIRKIKEPVGDGTWQTIIIIEEYVGGNPHKIVQLDAFPIIGSEPQLKLQFLTVNDKKEVVLISVSSGGLPFFSHEEDAEVATYVSSGSSFKKER